MDGVFFPYAWHLAEKEIHIYGFEGSGDVALLRVQDFTPYIYVKLPAHLDWSSLSLVHQLLGTLKRSAGRKMPLQIFKSSIMYKRPLYYAHLHYEQDQPKYELHPYLFLAFASEKDRRQFVYSVAKDVQLNGESFTVELYEHNATPVLQMTCLRGISTADWFRVRNASAPAEPLSRLEREYTVHWHGLLPWDAEERDAPSPLVCSFDIEANFHDPNKFSDGSHPNDVVFQISCVFGRVGQPKSMWERHLLTLGNPDPCLMEGVIVHAYRKEFQLIRGFNDLIVEMNPQILLGYNIFKFDISYLYKRAIDQDVHDEFVRHGCTRDKCKLETIRWSSSAYSTQEMTFLDLQGRLTIDLLTLVQRDFNLESYKLDTVADKFLGSGKDPLNHHDIFMCYHLGLRETERDGVSKALGLVGKYCVKDSELVLELFEKFQYWVSLTEMAKICQVPHAHLYLYGQQLKVFSQVYKYCFVHNIVVESGRYKTNDDDLCTGAYVFTPEPGLYDNVVSFDFQSLYPSIIISHNIDYSTLVLEEDVERIGRERLTHVAWGEHINCTCARAEYTKEKEVRCKNYSYYWLKDPIGVLPTIIRNLLDARKAVRKQMKSIDPQSLLYDVLNKRQLAYKVSSNSMYGAMTTRKGYLPFLPGGMCVTAIGRRSIEQVSQIIQQEHQGKIVYGDSVTGETPILVRHRQTQRVSVQTIESLGTEWGPYPGFHMLDLWQLRLEKQYSLCDYDVWSDQGWTPIRKVIRHKTEKRLFTVGSTLGVVTVTEDHSLLTSDRKPIRPGHLKLGERLLYYSPYVFLGATLEEHAAPVPELDAVQAFRLGIQCSRRVPEELFYATPGVIHRFLKGFLMEQFYPQWVFQDAALAQDFYLLMLRIGWTVRIETTFSDSGTPVYKLVQVDARQPYDDRTTVLFEHAQSTNLGVFVYDLETECGRFQAGVGQMIVKNTDSNYVMFPHLQSLQAIWDHSIHVSDAVSKRFPEPMRLEFEEHIYARYLILSKKRYLYFSCTPDGHRSNKIENKGVLLKRRDNSKVVRDIYEALIRRVLEREAEAQVLTGILDDIAKLYLRVPSPEEYQMSKSVKTIHGFQLTYRDAKTIRYGDYVVPRIKDTPAERQRQLEEKQVTTEEAFYQVHLPGAVQLALRMRARGQHIESGSRLSYVVTRRVPHKHAVADRMEEVEYFKLHYSKQMIDVLHYLHLLINPVEEVLTVIYGGKYVRFVKDMYKYRIKYDLVMDELFRMFHPVEYIE
jgi:DNA polymerase elongation subunit (family B)